MMLRQIIRWLGAYTILVFVLLLGVFGSVIIGLMEAIPQLDSGPLLATALLALVTGWLLAASPFPARLSLPLAMILGTELVFLRFGQLYAGLNNVLRALLDLIGLLWQRSPVTNPAWETAWMALSRAASGLLADAGYLLAQLGEWWRLQPNSNPLAVALVWNLLIWTVAGWATWSIRRYRRPLLGIAPTGALLAATLSLGGKTPATLLTLLLAALPLVACVRYHTLQQRWQHKRIGFPSDTGGDVSLAVVGLTIGLVSLGLLAPTISFQQIIQAARQALSGANEQAQQLASALGIEPGSAQTAVLPPLYTTGLPRQHLIGSGPELSQQIVMSIRIPPEQLDDASRFYWRSLTYDRYTGLGWQSLKTEYQGYQGGDLANALPETPHRVIQQEIRVEGEHDNLLYATGTMIRADRDYGIAWRLRLDPSRQIAHDRTDIFATTTQSNLYRVESWLPNVDSQQLRTTKAEIPDWIQERYQVLPSVVPSRVITLAQTLIAGVPNAYDQAKSIERYLRTFTYTLDLPAPPDDRDLVDLFLFDLERGYCDYYASAMVVLARAVELPARLVVGYASGTYQVDDGRFVVTQADAHSWPEVYIAGAGWIEFEPTAGLPARAAPDRLSTTPPSWRTRPTLKDVLRQLGAWWWLPLVALATAGLAWLRVEKRRLAHASASATSALLFRRLCNQGQHLGVPLRPGDTPYEFAARLLDRLAALAQGRRHATLILPAFGAIDALTELYVQASYSQHPPDPTTTAHAITSWQQLRWRLTLARLWSLNRTVTNHSPAVLIE